MSISGLHPLLNDIFSLPIQDASISTRSENELWDRGKDIRTFGDRGSVSLSRDIVNPCLPRRQSEWTVGVSGGVEVESDIDVLAAIVLDKLFRRARSGRCEGQNVECVELHSECEIPIVNVDRANEAECRSGDRGKQCTQCTYL